MVSERISHRILERRLGVIAPLAFTGWYRDVVDALDPPDHDVSPPDVAWTIHPSRNTTQAHSTSLASWRCRWHGWSPSGRELCVGPPHRGKPSARRRSKGSQSFAEKYSGSVSLTRDGSNRRPSR